MSNERVASKIKITINILTTTANIEKSFLIMISSKIYFVNKGWGKDNKKAKIKIADALTPLNQCGNVKIESFFNKKKF